MRVHKVTMDSKSLVNTVVLQDDSGIHKLILPLGALEAMMLTFGITNKALPFPFIHEIMIDAIENCGAKLKSIAIDTLEEGVFTSQIVVQHSTKQISYLCKPTDAILIAIKSKIPIQVAKGIINVLSPPKTLFSNKQKLVVTQTDDIARDILHASANSLWDNALSPVNKKINESIKIFGKGQDQTEDDKQMTELLLKLNPESSRKM